MQGAAAGAGSPGTGTSSGYRQVRDHLQPEHLREGWRRATAIPNRLPRPRRRHNHRVAGLLALEKKPWRYIFPAFLVIMGLTTLVLMATGNAKMGENGAAATVFPLGYAVTGILALCLAVILFMYPAGKYILVPAVLMFYLAFCWTFNGKSGLLSWAPVAPAIPPILTFAFVFGAVAAAIVYGGILIWNTYTRYGVNKA